MSFFSLHYSELFFLKRFQMKNGFQIRNMHRKIRRIKEKNEIVHMTLILLYIYEYSFLFYFYSLKISKNI